MPKRKTTRNAQGSGTIRQRKDGRWEARYTTGRDPGTGKQIQKSVYGATQQEVRKKMNQATAAIDEGLYREPTKITVGEWMDTWLAEYMLQIKPNTLHEYTAQVNNHIKPKLGYISLTGLDAPAIQKFYNGLLRGGMSPKTIKNIHGILHNALRQAVMIGLISFNPSDACALPRVTKKEIKPLEPQEISKLLEAIKRDRFENVFSIVLFTGLRRGEALGLTWDRINFNKGTISINKQLQLMRGGNAEYSLISTKNDKTRLIMPAPFVMRLFKAQRASQSKHRLAAGAAWGNKWNLVFTNELGEHLSPVTVSKAFKNAAVNIGRPDMHFHDLRHNYAVLALQAGDDPKTVQETLGHHTAAFTLDVYGHVTEQMKKASADRMESFINEISG